MKIVDKVYTMDDRFFYEENETKVHFNGKNHDGFLFVNLYNEGESYAVTKLDAQHLFKEINDKGAKFGICNRGACDTDQHVVYFNQTMNAYYCPFCSERINASCKGESYFPLCKASREDMIALYGERGKEYPLFPS